MSHPRRYTILTATALDFELDPRDAADLGAHLAGCADCRRLRQALREDAAQAGATRRDPPPLVRERVLSAAAGPRVIVPRGPSFQLVGVVALLVLLIGLLAAISLVGGRLSRLTPSPFGLASPGPSTSVASPAVAPSRIPEAGRLLAGVSVSGGATGVCRPACAPTAATIGFGSVWVSALDAIVRVDPSSAATTARIPMKGPVTHLVDADGSLWALVPSRGVVVRVDPATNRVVTTIAVGKDPTDVAFAGGSLWVASEAASALTHFDPTTGRSSGSVALVHPATALAVAGESLWAATSSGLVQLDPTTGRMRTIVGGACCELAVGEGALWVSDGGLRLWRVDPASARATELAAPGDYSGSLAFGAGSLWAFDGLDLTLERIDPADPTRYAKTSLPGLVPPGASNQYASGGWAPAIAVGSGAVWVRSYDPDLLLEVATQASP